MVEVEVALDDVADDFELGIPGEGHLAGKHDVEDDPERPNVDLRVVILQEHLWRDVVWLDKERSELDAQAMQATGADLRSHSLSSWSPDRKSLSRGRSRSFSRRSGHPSSRA